MKFTPTKLGGAYVVEPEKIGDERGFFARLWCRDAFAAQGLAGAVVQANVSFNARRGTVRGMHYQAAPHAEVKLVRCTRGALYDVAVDLRPGSPTYRQWVGAELTAENHRMLYVPEGFAHGYLTLEDATEITYLTSCAYAPEAERGVRYNDPSLGIAWPIPVEVVSEKDRAWADFDVAPDDPASPLHARP